jgi:hypothetical protein
MELLAPEQRIRAERQHSARTEASMIVLSHQKNGQLLILVGDETIVVEILDVGCDHVRIGIVAPIAMTAQCEAEVESPPWSQGFAGFAVNHQAELVGKQ